MSIFESTKCQEKYCRAILQRRQQRCHLQLEDLSDRTAYATLLQLFNQMLAVTQSVAPVKVANTEKVQQFGFTLMLHQRKKVSHGV